MQSREIRQIFVDFFKERQHQQLPSSSLVPPATEKNLLLSNAGMNQMIPYFLGMQKPPAVRMTTVQKCFRTVDIDEVGDPSHLTFFEMLGNFSVGDYFKEQALVWSWELLTQVYKIPGELLTATIHPTDEEAYRIWTERVGLPAERVFRDESNWWIAGTAGPCGPDSEIYYDLGEQFGPHYSQLPVFDNPRYLEIWNNVFMQFNRDENGVDTPLPRPNIDTGMGLERLSIVMQGVKSIYDTDLFQVGIRRVGELTGKVYGQNERDDTAMRVIADHSRGMTFLINDGVVPGNIGRGYILRRIMRRAVRYGYMMGLDKPFLTETSQAVIDLMGEAYPELVQNRERIFADIRREEAAFRRTLTRGLDTFERIIAGLKVAGDSTFPAQEAFTLFTQDGFPYDLTRELAQERGFTIDEVAYKTLFDEHRKVSKSIQNALVKPDVDEYKRLGVDETPFRGYITTKIENTRVLGIFVDGKNVETVEDGQAAEIVLAETPFFVAKGGQVNDIGFVAGTRGRFNVSNAERPFGEVIVHQGVVEEGSLSVGDEVEVVVEHSRRMDIARNHTGTHIVHSAIKEVLGTEVGQRGSLVAPDRLRFDFNYPQPLSDDQIRQIEEIVNEKIRDDLGIEVVYTSYEDALKRGAIAIFGERYEDLGNVRVVDIGHWSVELCGGTHLHRSGEIGGFVIVSQTNVGGGLRRIEALTGRGAERYFDDQRRLIREATQRMNINAPERLPDEIDNLRNQLRTRERELAQLREKAATGQIDEIVAGAHNVGGVRVAVARADVGTQEVLRSLADKVRDKLGEENAVVVLGAVFDDRPSLTVRLTRDLTKRGLKAGSIVNEVAAVLGGKGGGRPEAAEAGGGNPAQLDVALAEAPAIVQKGLG